MSESRIFGEARLVALERFYESKMMLAPSDQIERMHAHLGSLRMSLSAPESYFPLLRFLAIAAHRGAYPWPRRSWANNPVECVSRRGSHSHDHE